MISLIPKIKKSSSNNLLEDLPSPQKHRHMAGLLTLGSNYLPRLPAQIKLSSDIMRRSSPITAAGPYRIFTGFPTPYTANQIFVYII